MTTYNIQAEAKPQQWEYLVCRINDSGEAEPKAGNSGAHWGRKVSLDKLGEDCWELVTIGNWKDGFATGIFKRPKTQR